MNRIPYQIVGLSFLLGLLLTPVVRRITTWAGIVDAPDGHRKLHGRIVPLGGGVAILLAAIGAIGSGFLLELPWSEVVRRESSFLVALGSSALLICLIGLVDDAFELRGRQKLLGQVVTVFCLVVLSDQTIRHVDLFGWSLDLGVFAVPITMLWLLGAINSLNLIDGVDGLATTVGVVMSVAVAVMAAMTNHVIDSVAALAMAGGLAGFLAFNLPPAKMFLGDAGSMLIGLVLGVLAIRSSLKGPATVALAAPTAIWAVLFFDVGMAIVRRKLTGRSLYTTDRGHLHHVLQKRGFSGWMIVFIVGLMCALCAAGALVSVYAKSEFMAVAAAGAVLATLVATRFFGHSECGLLAQRLRGLASSLVRLPYQPPSKPRPLKSRFQGQRRWDLMWEELLLLAEHYDLCTLRLNVTAPAIGEEYHAYWERREHPAASRLWQTEIPLFAGDLTIGRIAVSGAVTQDSAFGYMAEFIDSLKPLEQRMQQLVTPEPIPAPHFRETLAAART